MESQHQDPADRFPQGSAPDPTFRQLVDARGRVRAHGDLTPHTAAQLRGTVEALHSSGVPGLELDLRGLGSIDDAALGSLHAVRAAIEADGGRLTVLDPGVGQPSSMRATTPGAAASRGVSPP